MREHGSAERPWSVFVSSAVYETIKGQLSTYKDRAVPAGRACRLVRGQRANLALVMGRPQCCDTLLRDLTEFSQMTLLCAGFALGRAVSKDGCKWTLRCLPLHALPRAHECLRLMRGRRDEEMWAEEKQTRTGLYEGCNVGYRNELLKLNTPARAKRRIRDSGGTRRKCRLLPTYSNTNFEKLCDQ